MSLTTTIKVNDYQIALFGGLTYFTSKDGNFVSPTSEVLLFDVRVPSFTYAPVQLNKPFVSICMPFFSKKEGKIFLINEQVNPDERKGSDEPDFSGIGDAASQVPEVL